MRMAPSNVRFRG